MKHDTNCKCEGCQWAHRFLEEKRQMNRPSCHGDYPFLEMRPHVHAERDCFTCAYAGDCSMRTIQMNKAHTTAQAKGAKADSGKPRWSLLPLHTIAQVIKVLEAGAAKYSVGNWEHVPDARTRYYDATMRHVQAWWAGEKLDPESGLPHLAHATASILFLMWFDERKDDRDVSELVDVMNRRMK